MALLLMMETTWERGKERESRQRSIQHTEVGVLLLLTSCQIKGKQGKGSFYPSLLHTSTHLCSSLSLTSPHSLPALHFITLHAV